MKVQRISENIYVMALCIALTGGLLGCNNNPEPSVNKPESNVSKPEPGVSSSNTAGSTSLPTPEPPKSTAQMLLGNPDGATSVATNKEHYLITRDQYAMSFNETLHYPNWVAWHLQKKDLGELPRVNFTPDPDLPAGFVKITPGDYTNSGFDRGHNCPAADRDATPDDARAVFYMSNITPQYHGMNAGPWERLESWCRDQTKQGNELYIVCGHGFSSRTHKTIGRAKIAVPDFGWKIVVILPEKAGDDLKRITAQTRVIAVKITNINTIANKNWTDFRTTPAEIEKATGLTLFSALPSPVADALRSKKDSG